MELITHKEKQDYFNVEADGTRIGGFRLNFKPDQKAIELCDLNVFPAYRNKGYGTQIIRDLVTTMFSSGKADPVNGVYDNFYAFIDADNPDVQRFYSRIGEISDCMNEEGRYQVTLFRSASSIPAMPISIPPINDPTIPAPAIDNGGWVVDSVSNKPVTSIDSYYGGNMRQWKAMDFPKSEWKMLQGMNEIVTHRVGNEFNMYNVGDYVTVPWGDVYCVVGRNVSNGWYNSPFADRVTPQQANAMRGYDWTAVLTLHRLSWSTHDGLMDTDTDSNSRYDTFQKTYDEYLKYKMDNLMLEEINKSIDVEKIQKEMLEFLNEHCDVPTSTYCMEKEAVDEIDK